MTDNPPTRWTDLRRFTPARVGLGRAGNALPTAPHLAFQAAHAAARDAVHAPLDVQAVQSALEMAGIPSVVVRSAAADRRTYLMRPDLGRQLPPAEAARLPFLPGSTVVVVSDGLSATGVQSHAAPLLTSLFPALRRRGPVAPVVVASQGRVALGDAIAAAIGAQAVVVLIGERPGLSAADSLGAYLTWSPRPGSTDADRNCVSNIRPGGLALDAAVGKLLWLLDAMRRMGTSGVALKDEQPAGLPTPPAAAQPGALAGAPHGGTTGGAMNDALGGATNEPRGGAANEPRGGATNEPRGSDPADKPAAILPTRREGNCGPISR